MSEENIDIKICEDPNAEVERKFKIVVIGDPYVGKTNLIQRFINNTFIKDSKPTYQATFTSKKFIINNEIFTFEIWDGANSRYQSHAGNELKHARGVLLLYDATNESSFDSIEGWYLVIKERARNGVIVILVGTKIDLKDRIVVNSEMSQKQANSLNIEVFETSALDSTNVQEVFLTLIKKMYQFMKSEEKLYTEHTENNEPIVQLNVEPQKTKNKCIK